MGQARQKDIAILGAGCAGLSLAARASQIQAGHISLFGPADGRPPHIWGFWQMGWMDEPARLARKSWHRWMIAGPSGCHIQQARRHPYQALDSEVWMADCRQKIAALDIPHIARPVQRSRSGQLQAGGRPLMASRVLDSRPPEPDEGILLQHFLGLEIETDRDIFDPDTARLMDFRTDQAAGLNFIYLLPFGPRNALVESTFFSPRIQPEKTYQKLMRDYLKEQFGLTDFAIGRRESAVIPMGQLRPHDRLIDERFGSNGGALRPSSGYGFAFIQKQIAAMLADGQTIARPGLPHRRLDLWLDRVFLRVISDHPERAPALFLGLGAALDGDGMARFMSGMAGLSDYLAVIRAMPASLFVPAALGWQKGKADG